MLFGRLLVLKKQFFESGFLWLLRSVTLIGTGKAVSLFSAEAVSNHFNLDGGGKRTTASGAKLPSEEERIEIDL